MTKLIFVNRYFYPDESATSQLASDLTTALAGNGHAVEVVTSRQLLNDPNAGLAPTETAGGVIIHRIRTSCWGRRRLLGRVIDYLTFYLSAAFKLARIVKRGDVIVAKTDPPLISAVAGFIAWCKGATLVNWMQDIYPEVAERLHVSGLPIVGGFLRRIRNSTCRSAHTNVVIGRCMQDYLSLMKIPENKIRVVPNWVNDQRIKPLPAEQNFLRKAWGMNGNFVIGYSGNMGRGHDFELLLKAADMLRDEPEVTFLFIGDGARRTQLEEQFREARLENVLFQPYQPNRVLPVSLTVPDLHVVTLQHEIAGLIVPSKFYGALAAGRPVLYIGPDESEIAKIISESKCGFCFSGTDPEEVSNAIRTLHRDPELRQQMGKNAREALETTYSRERSVALWHEVLESALGHERAVHKKQVPRASSNS